MDRPSMTTLTKVFYDTDIGKSAVSTTSLMLQVTAKQTLAFDKLARASKMLKDERLPDIKKASPDEGTELVIELTEVVNCSLLEGTAAGVLEESLSDLGEVCRLLSHGTTLEKSEEISKWCELALDRLELYDELYTLQFGIVATAGGFEALIQHPAMRPLSSESSKQGEEEGDHGKNMGGLTTILQTTLFDDEPLVRVAERFRDFLTKSMPDAIRKNVPVDDLAKRIDCTILNNHAVRAKTMRVFDALADLDEAPSDVTAALADWRSKQNKTTKGTSFLEKAVSLQQVVSEMIECTLSPPKHLNENDEVRMQCDPNLPTNTCVVKTAFQMQDALRRSHPVQQARVLISQVVQTVLDEFAASLDLSGILMPLPEVEGSGNEHVAMALDSFYSPEFAVKAGSLVSKIFSVGRQQEVDWCSKNWFDLLLRLTDVIPGDVQVSMAKFCQPGKTAPTGTIAECIRVCHVAARMSQVAQTFAFLKLRCTTEEPVCRGTRVKDEVELAMGSALFETRAALRILTEPGALPAFVPQARWAAPIPSAKSWFDAANAAGRLVARHILSTLVASATALARELAAATPPTAHIVSDELWNARLAKQQLLGWPSRESLNTKSVGLFHLLGDCSRVHTAWGLSPSLASDPEYEHDLASAQAVFANAKAAVLTIAAANVVLEMHGPAQKNKALELIKKRNSEVPKALAKELAKIAGVHE